MLNPDNIDIVIYHHPCPDGCTSGTIANMYFKSIKKTVDFWGLSHSPNPPPELYNRLKDKNVLICDFSFKKEIINKILEIAKNLLIIDHHISAQKDLQDIDPKYKIFDMAHSGAYLVWLYFYPNVPVPLFVKYIEDNDIWLKAMQNTLEVTAFVASLELIFDEYEKFIVDETNIANFAIPTGTILLKQAQKQTDVALTKSTVKMIDSCNNIYFVGVCNSTTNINEVGNQMLTKYPYIDFSVIYSSNNGSNNGSLRSDDTRADTSIIASKYGGGGHRNASGCSLYDKTVPGFEIGDYNNYKQLTDLNFIFNKEKNYNYVMINTTQNKIQFVKYLLQTRALEENIEIQEACSLYRQQKNNQKINIKFDFAVSWHFGDSKTWFVLHWSNQKEYDIKKLFGSFNDFEITEGKKIVKFSIAGLNLEIL
jgi:oligoribonuclease NrnB/cAMP/cGMP phosphodiesterase (DHH superfamily)